MLGFHLFWTGHRVPWTILTSELRSSLSDHPPHALPITLAVVAKAHAVQVCCRRGRVCRPQCISQYCFSVRSIGFGLRKRQAPTSRASAANAIAISAMVIFMGSLFVAQILLSALSHAIESLIVRSKMGAKRNFLVALGLPRTDPMGSCVRGGTSFADNPDRS